MMFDTGKIAFLKQEARYLPSYISAFANFAVKASYQHPLTLVDSSALCSILLITAILNKIIRQHA